MGHYRLVFNYGRNQRKKHGKTATNFILVLLSRNKLYYLLTIACIAGYSWLYFSMNSNQSQQGGFEVCLIKHVTDIPCPSCGSTRSVVSLVQGNFIDALYMNPRNVAAGT